MILLNPTPLHRQAGLFGPGRRVSESAVCGWLAQAEPGDTLEYHRGFLILDVDPSTQRLPDIDRAELIRVARRVLWAAENNLVHLVQRRFGLEVFGYLAVARPQPRAATAVLSALLTKEAA